MKKQEEVIRKMKLEDYEIGRTLGKGTPAPICRWFR